MRPSFIEWASSKAGVYLPDKQIPTLATWQPYQCDILNHLFPESQGRLPYNRIIWSEPKKSGKTLLSAGIQLYYALFVDVPGEQYVLANDLEGASDRTWQTIKRSLEAATKIKVLRGDDWSTVGTKIKLSNGSEIKALANDYKGGAGGNQSLASVDEVWGFTQPKDLGLLTEFAPVPTRENSTAFYTGYQGYEGESNYWHDMIDRVLANGKPIPELAHIDNGDGAPACYAMGRTFLFYSHLARHPWHTKEFMDEQQANSEPSEYIRVWENRRTKNVNALCTDEQWDKLYDPLLRALYTGDRRPLVLGADAATKSDTCALVGTTFNFETRKVEMIYGKIWTPERHEPLKLTATIGPEIIRLHREYNVVACYYDPYQMAAISEMCTSKGVKMFEFPQTSLRIKSDTHLRDLIRGGNLAHYGDEETKAHVTAAVVRDHDRGYRIEKKTQTKKIDAAVGLSMSAQGAVEQLATVPSSVEATSNPFYPEEMQ